MSEHHTRTLMSGHAPPSRSMADESIGARYQVLGKLGSGGMSRVLRALDRARDEAVAVKILSDGTPLGILGGEFRYIASLNHPGVVNVYDFGLTTDRRPYFTMEIVGGGNLVSFAKAAPLDATVLAVRSIFETLAFVHARGIVHGDLKPSNILVGSNRRGQHQPKLLDFGVAWNAEHPERGISGTIHYIAPEIIQQAPRDHRVDLYAMGVVLYQLLTGSLPYDAPETWTLLQHHLSRPVPDPRDRKPSVPAELAEISLRLMEKSPAERFQSAREVLAALDGWRASNASAHDASGTGSWAIAQPRVDLAGGSRFVGRERELGALLDAAASVAPRQSKRPGGETPAPRRTDAPTGPPPRRSTVPPRRGALRAIVGDAGSGKTRLLQEMRVRVQLEGLRCLVIDLQGASSAAEPFERVAKLIDSVLGGASELCARLGELARPGLDSDAWAAPEVALGEQLAEAAVALATLCHAHAAREPMVLAFDGIDSLPKEASSAARALLARLIEAPICVVATASSGCSWLDVLAPADGPMRIELQPLERDHTRELVRSLLGEMDGAAVIDEHAQRESGGNPAAIVRVVRALATSGAIVLRHGVWVVAEDLHDKLPPVEADAAQRQIARATIEALDDDAHELAEVAALLGDRFDGAMLQALVPDAELDARLRRLVDARVLDPEGNTPDVPPTSIRYRFAQRQLREELVARLDPARAEAIGARIIATLDPLRASGSPEDLVVLAEQLLRGARRADAAREAARVLRRTKRTGPPEGALAVLRAALGEQPDEAGLEDHEWYDLAVELAQLERRRGDGECALRWLERVATRSALETQEPLLARAAVAARLELGDLLMERGDARGDQVLQEALASARGLADARLLGRAHYTHAHRLMLNGHWADALNGVASALDCASQTDDSALRARSLKLRAMLHWSTSRLAEAETDARAATSVYRSLGWPLGTAEALGTLGNVLWSAGRLNEARAAFQEALENATEAGWLTGLGKLHNCLGVIAYGIDDWDGACDQWHAALRIAERTNNTLERVLPICNIALVAMYRGDLVGSLDLAEEALTLAREAPFAQGEARVLGNLGELHRYRDEPDRARTRLLEGRRVCVAIGAVDLLIECERRLLELELATGETAAATIADQAQTLKERAHAASVKAELPHLLRVRGEALAQAGEREAAETTLQEAHASFQELGSGYEAARVVRVAATLASDGLLGNDGLAATLAPATRLLRRLRAQPELEKARAAAQHLGAASFGSIGQKPSTLSVHSIHSLPPEPPRLDDVEGVRTLLGLALSLSTLDLETVLGRAVDAALELTGTERGFVIVCDHQGQPTFRVSRGAAGIELHDDVEVSRTIVERVRATRRRLLMRDMLSESVLRLGVRTVACLPLLREDRLVGVLYLDARARVPEWTESRLQLLEALAAYAAVALENARLYQEQTRKNAELAAAAHELGPALDTLNDYATRLRDEVVGLGGAPETYASVVLEQAKRLLRSVASLLDVAATEASSLSWSMVSVQVKDVVEAAIEQVRPMALLRDITVAANVPAGLPTILGSRERLIEMLTAMLGQLVRPAERGGTLTVRARAIELDPEHDPPHSEARRLSDPLLNAQRGYRLSAIEGVRIELCDEEVRRNSQEVRVQFDTGGPWERLDTGLGLGLPFAREVVQRHGGRLLVEETPTGGICYAIVLPALEQDAEAHSAE